MTSSKRRVLCPDDPTKVLPCIGSQAHTTGCPAAVTARTSGGSRRSTRSAPRRVISVSRPGVRRGSRRAQIATASSGVALGPSLTPTGLPTPERNSRWAPSNWRVRSPTQSRCAEVSYQPPVRLSLRVMACSKPSSSASWEVKKSTWWIGEELDRSTPQAAMKRSARLMASAAASKRRPARLLATNSRFQLWTWFRSATRASSPCRVRTSPAKTSGGCLATWPRTWSRAAGSGQSGCCAAGSSRHEPGAHAVVWAFSRDMPTSWRFAAWRRNRLGRYPRLPLARRRGGAEHRTRATDGEVAMAAAGEVRSAEESTGAAPSYVHGASGVPLLGETIGQNLDRTAATFPDRDALVSVHQGIRQTYAEFHAAVEEVARGLLALGIEPGDRVGIWSPNNAEWATLQYATAKVGAILVNINPAYRTSELAYALGQSGVSTLVLARGFRQADYVAMVEAVAGETPALTRKVVL